MDWNVIGAIAEIAGAIAVVVSLVYLASQIKHSNHLMTLEATKYATDLVIPFMDMMLVEDDLLDLMIKDPSDLSEREQIKLKLLGRRMIVTIRQMYLAKDEIRLMEETISMCRAAYHRDKMNYGMPTVWPEYKQELPTEFVAWFEDRIVSER